MTDIDKAKVISFLWLQTGHDFGILKWKHVGTQNISPQSTKLRVVNSNMHHQMTGMHKYHSYPKSTKIDKKKSNKKNL